MRFIGMHVYKVAAERERYSCVCLYNEWSPLRHVVNMLPGSWTLFASCSRFYYRLHRVDTSVH